MKLPLPLLSHHSATRTLGASLLVLVLSACGGGGGGDSTADVNTGSTGTGTGSTPTTSATGTCELSDFQNELLTRINALRAAGASCGAAGNFPATTPLSWHTALATAADGHATDMAAKNYFSHTSQDGRSMSDRVTAAGYGWSALGENIAAGQTTVEAVMSSWRNSDGHCANLMNANYVHVGVACRVATAQNASYSRYWVMDLGRPN